MLDPLCMAASRTGCPSFPAVSESGLNLPGLPVPVPALPDSAQGPTRLYWAEFDASWEIDLFGGTRRSVEAASAEADAVGADLADVQVSLAAEVAKAYINLRDAQHRLQHGEQSNQPQQQALELARQRRARGAATELDIERLSQVDDTRATLIALDEQIVESSTSLRC